MPKPRRFPVWITFVVLGLVVVFCLDPINRLRLRFLFENLITVGWENGLWHVEKMPLSATPEQVARAYYRSIASITIRRKEPLSWPDGGEYTVVVTNNGIMVMKPAFGGWAVRDY